MSVWFENNKRFIESLSHFGRLKSNSLTLRARSLFLRPPRSLGIILNLFNNG